MPLVPSTFYRIELLFGRGTLLCVPRKRGKLWFEDDDSIRQAKRRAAE
jgi:hypothetical protein